MQMTTPAHIKSVAPGKLVTKSVKSKGTVPIGVMSGKRYTEVQRKQFKEFAESAFDFKALTKEEQRSIQFYAGIGSLPIAEYIQTGVVPKDFPEKLIKDSVKQLDKTFAHSTLTRDINTLRGTGIPDNVMSTLGKGSTLEFKSYLSTTVHEDTAKFFATKKVHANKSLLKIKIPKGSKILPVASSLIGENGEADDFDEAEVLLPRNSRFKVNSITTNRINGENVSVIEVTLL